MITELLEELKKLACSSLDFWQQRLCSELFRSAYIVCKCKGRETALGALYFFMPEIHRALSFTVMSLIQSFPPKTWQAFVIPCKPSHKVARNPTNPFILFTLGISHQRDISPTMCQNPQFKNVLSLHIIKLWVVRNRLLNSRWVQIT